MKKTNQLQLNIENKEKIKYYTAFSYLDCTPLFKAKLFEYFDYDIKRAFLATKEDIEQACLYYDLNIPRTFYSQKQKLDIEECYKKAFDYEGVKIVTWEDELYPPLLKEIPDFPLSMYYIGTLKKEYYDFPVAIVGSRMASTTAKNALNRIVRELKNSPITIFSGIAYGIDATAHQAALDNNLKTIAVIATGVDDRYPNQNKKLYQDILDNGGAILSEYPLKTTPYKGNFPQRNRIVVGSSKGTLVAEAKIHSGAMISANLTLEYNRELMCMPGDIMNPNTSGIYHLIKNGASIVTSGEDILNSLDWDVVADNKKENIELNDLQKKIMDILALEAKSFDDIMTKIEGADISNVLVTLTELELKCLIKQQDNKYYRL